MVLLTRHIWKKSKKFTMFSFYTARYTLYFRIMKLWSAVKEAESSFIWIFHSVFNLISSIFWNRQKNIRCWVLEQYEMFYSCGAFNQNESSCLPSHFLYSEISFCNNAKLLFERKFCLKASGIKWSRNDQLSGATRW